MGNLLALAGWIDRVTEWVGKAVGWCILAAVLLSAGNAVVRKVFNISSNAFLEAQWYLYGAAFLGAAAYTLRQNEHIRIDIVYGALSRRLKPSRKSPRTKFTACPNGSRQAAQTSSLRCLWVRHSASSR